MYAVGENGFIKIFVEIFGAKMNKYFNHDTYETAFNVNKLNTIFSGIGPNFSKVTFTTTHKQQYLNMWIVFHDEEIGDSIYEMKLDKVDNSETTLNSIKDCINESNNYPIIFKMPMKNLKTKISELKKLSGKFEIQQFIKNKLDRDGQVDKIKIIKFFTVASQPGIKNTSPFTGSKITIEKSYFEGSAFTAPLFISNIKQIANSNISDTVEIRVDQNKDIVFKCLIDFDKSGKNMIVDSEKAHIYFISKLAISENNPTL